MARQNDLRMKIRNPGNRRVEVMNLEPKKHAISRWKLGIADRTMMVLIIPIVQLKYQATI